MGIFDSDAEKVKKILYYWESELKDESMYKTSIINYLKNKLGNEIDNLKTVHNIKYAQSLFDI